MSALSPSNSIRLLLVAAAIHLLGACPCGCLEHNAWRQSIVALIGHESPLRTGDDGNCDGEHRCHDSMLASDRARTLESHGANLLAADGVSFSISDRGAASSGLLAASAPPLARPSLSRLQVLRL